jgi:crotonobetainyl-CoA:carnitine CoA-transferase CaiB-like acyl-CoA transferase
MMPGITLLDGIRILDLTRVVAGPLVTKQLADLGAEIIKVESIQVPDETRYQRVIPVWPENNPGDEPWNTGYYFNNHNRNKIGVTLDLGSGWGQDLLMRLASISDVVAENYRPGVLDRMGISYERFREANPDIIMITMNGFGDYGPFRKFGAYGSTVEAQSGLAALNGQPGEKLILTGMPYGDWCTGMLGPAAILVALDHRRRTGQGQKIDLSQSELVANFAGDAILGHHLTGETPVEHSNKLTRMAPHGYYPAAGDDEWIGIAVEDDARWQALCEVMGRPQLAGDPRFGTLADRKRNEGELDTIVAEWTRGQDKFELFRRLEAAGIAAGPVQHGKDVFLDQQLRARDYFQRVVFEPERHMPPLDYARYPAVFDGARPGIRFPAPDLGGATAEILGGLLGVSEEELAALAETEITGTVPLSNFDWSPVDLDLLRSTGSVKAEEPDYRKTIGLDD